MQSRTDVFSPQEKLIHALRSLYEGFGYARFPMRRFEEYSLYLENKSFLKSESVLAFADVNGRLMALKPDVTLSIVKHFSPKAAGVQKLYYRENVYRASQTAHEFAEIEQIGVELLGEVDLFGMCEVLRLAVESLRATGADYVLEVSHMGFAGGLMDEAGLTPEEKAELYCLIRQKNGHELLARLGQLKVPEAQAERIARLSGLSGAFEATLPKAEALAGSTETRAALRELSEIHGVLAALGLSGHLRLDFSILNDLDYYNGIVFQGYVKGVPRLALSGGRYDHLMRKFGKPGGGMGFALYPNELDRLFAEPADDDVDTLILYEAGSDAAALAKAVDGLRAEGRCVLALPAGASPPRAARTLAFADGRFQEVG
jgi:ATP phosphoribosyltransferase regulatory subunit